MNSLNRLLLWPDVDRGTRIEDLVRRATREFETGPLQPEAQFRYPDGPNETSRLALALLIPWNRGRETGQPPTRRLRFAPAPSEITLNDVLIPTPGRSPIASAIATGRDLNYDPGQVNTWLLRLTPVEPEVRVNHPPTAPDARRAVCNGTCVYDGWSLDNPEELNPLPPDVSSPPDSDDGDDTIMIGASPAAVELELRMESPPPPPPATPQPLGAIWSTPFRERQTALPRVTSIPSFALAALNHATNPSYPGPNLGLHFPPILSIRAETIDEGANEYEYIIQCCYADRDATMLLTPNHSFELVPPSGEPSSGEGVERELLQALIARRFRPSHNLSPRFGDLLAFQPSTDDARVPSTEAELREAWITGALLTLSVIRNGHLPQNFMPLQWHLAMNNGDVDSLTRDVLDEFTPPLLQVLDELRELGPSGDLTVHRSFYAQYLDFDVGRLRHRDAVSHEALIPFTLYRTLFGPPSLDHPQMIAFMEGASLTCSNGFSVRELTHAFSGGSAALLHRIIEGQITEPEDLAAIIDIVEPSITYVHQLHAIPDHTFSTFGQFLHKFLRGKDWPQPGLADDLRLLASVTDSEVADPTFRSRMFHRAAFNRDLILAGSRIRVTFTGTNSHDASSLALDTRRQMANGKTLLWRTCLGTVYIPATTILHFLQAEYPDGAGFDSSEQAIDHWLMTEVITAARGGIGGTL
ncbi:hypothetical protein M407DRAFT_17922 [Tulasnella calospora MUT 4182]|uniref:HECT domain-containing protein n=1 Tax=Tulasnella calospora MUT 4182 TaxID=1051891 RepID=A0A0C3QWS1_9AGAM|nr:hypothetical protein M407DRAFT_17922 [Tulasnella calospora MUT 4182]